MTKKVEYIERIATGYLTETMLDITREQISPLALQEFEFERSTRGPLKLEEALKYNDYEMKKRLLTPPELSLLYARLFSTTFCESTAHTFDLYKEYAVNDNETTVYGPPYWTNWCLGKKDDELVISAVQSIEGDRIIPDLEKAVVIPQNLLKRTKKNKQWVGRDYACGEIWYWKKLERGFAFPVIKEKDYGSMDSPFTDKGRGLFDLEEIKSLTAEEFKVMTFGDNSHSGERKYTARDHCYLRLSEPNRPYGAIINNKNRGIALKVEELNSLTRWLKRFLK